MAPEFPQVTIDGLLGLLPVLENDTFFCLAVNRFD